jgi:hypothetical protein
MDATTKGPIPSGKSNQWKITKINICTVRKNLIQRETAANPRGTRLILN